MADSNLTVISNVPVFSRKVRRSDPGEKNNISATNSEKAGLMYQQLMDGLKSFVAWFPKPNPNADPNMKVYDPNNLSETTLSKDDL